ncbi:Retrovirus-related Pol polyprotein from transposon TNT 1-94 [Vitis vinifera]|uniref:Retrovirus-related Pol polyprotein from transposon TNT 1-94 n=1 Tax=Vitis vinifera TaxID=29760 RepID=A0A438BTB0_VITVI|nr:Retrovirus-related Pol polyprotein from transposon TNT 1-94 [Vitis vinifera]
MRKVPYASAVGSLMYVMVCMRLDIAHVVGVVSRCTDADMAGDDDSRKSTSGYLITFLGGVVSWQSRLQKCVVLSTIEVEYITIIEASKELL